MVAGSPKTHRLGVGDERDELCDVIDELYGIELITATGGNVSVRVPGEEAMWITPSAMFKGNLDPEIMVKMGMDGKKIGDGGSPSSESIVHIAMYRARPRAKAVIHCHAARRRSSPTPTFPSCLSRPKPPSLARFRACLSSCQARPSWQTQ